MLCNIGSSARFRLECAYMLKRLLKEKPYIISIFIITLIVVVISYKNYVPGTWFTGWDNLHPEFNFKLNLHRVLNAVWQENQGLGLLSGMSHSADLPRILILLPFSLIFRAEPCNIGSSARFRLEYA